MRLSIVALAAIGGLGLFCDSAQAGRWLPTIENPYCPITTYMVHDMPEQAASMKDPKGRPIIVVNRRTFRERPSYSKFLIAHECCHHTLGHVGKFRKGLGGQGPQPFFYIAPELKRLELLGQVSRGYYIESHYGTQFGLPEAIELLRECRARRSDGKELGYLPDERIFTMSGHDPANLYMKSLDILDDRGIPLHRTMKSGNVHVRLVIQAGQVLLYVGSLPANVRQLAEMDGRRIRRCFEALKSRPNGNPALVAIRRWNGHPIDISPMARILWEEGFRFNGKKELVYPPSAEIEMEPDTDLLDIYKPYYSEEAPVEYNEDWVLSRSDEKIRAKLEELFAVLNRHLPDECSYNYNLPLMIVQYREKRCAFIHIQRKQIRLHVSYHGWAPGLAVQPRTDLDDPQFIGKLFGRFQKVFDAIDVDLRRM